MRPLLTLLIAVLMTTTSTAADQPTPPDAAKKPHVVRAPHGAERQDEYYWLRDDSRKNPEMLAYLHAENAYADLPANAVEGDETGEVGGNEITD